MFEHLPNDIRDGIAAAQRRDLKRKSRLRVHIGGEIFPILRLWEDGMALDATHASHLRGLVDIFDGSRHIMQCLIVASMTENGELLCDFKRSTPVSERPPLDFIKDENAPTGYLPKA